MTLITRPTRKLKERVLVYAGAAGSFDPPVKITATILTEWGRDGRFARHNRQNMSINLVTAGGRFMSRMAIMDRLTWGRFSWRIRAVHKNSEPALAGSSINEL